MFMSDWFKNKTKTINQDQNEEQENISIEDIECGNLLGEIELEDNKEIELPQANSIIAETVVETSPVETDVEAKEEENKMENNMSEQESKETSKLEVMLTNVLSAFTAKQEQVESEEVTEMVAKSELDAVSSEMKTFKAEKEVEISTLNEKVETLEVSCKEQLEKLEVIEAEKTVAKEEAIVAKYLAEAKDYPALVGTQEEVALKLREISESDLSDELKDEMKTGLKAKNNSNEELMIELGSEVNDNSELDEKAKKEKELYAKAEEMAKADGITREQAIFRLNK